MAKYNDINVILDLNLDSTDKLCQIMDKLISMYLSTIINIAEIILYACTQQKVDHCRLDWKNFN